jgi:hypothetical protein
MKGRRAWSTRAVVVLALTALMLLGGVHAAPAATAQATQNVTLGETGTWVGDVVRHGSHFDYVGRPCPVEVDVCAEFVARYRIVPVTAQAFLALPTVAGGPARLTGRLLTYSDAEHQGILFVSRVEAAPSA